MLLKHIRDKYKIISIVGLAKNSGKTVTLNHLIQEAGEEDIRLGLISTGRDGEALDLVTKSDKPKIFVEEGTIITTTTDLLKLGDAGVEILDMPGYKTPLGQIIIGKIRARGHIQISGPQTSKEIRELANKIIKLGGDLIIIDGAIDRKAAAAPSITDATILSTGAVVSRDMDLLIEETLHMVRLFNLPRLEGTREREVLSKILEKGRPAIINQELESHPIQIKTALGGGGIIGGCLRDDSKYIGIPGSLTKTTIEDIIGTTDKYKNVEIVVADGTKIFIPPKDWLAYIKYGIRVRVLNPIKLVAITLNPYAPQGYYFEPRDLLDRMKYYIKDIPVMDLILGGE